MQITIEMPDNEFELMKSLVSDDGRLRIVTAQSSGTQEAVERMIAARGLQDKGLIETNVPNIGTFKFNLNMAGYYLLKVAGVVKP